MRPKQVKRLKCPECDELICKDDLPEETTVYQCSECEELYENREEAEECCKD